MPVLGIGQIDRFDQVFVVCDQRVTDMGVHQIARTLQTHAREIIALTKSGGDPLLVDAIGPLCPIKV
jgi:hypothetical protein